MRPVEPVATICFYILVNLPREHVVRLVKVDVQELFESRKVSERCRRDGPWDKVRAWKLPRLEPQRTPRINVGKVGYQFDEVFHGLQGYRRFKTPRLKHFQVRGAHGNNAAPFVTASETEITSAISDIDSGFILVTERLAFLSRKSSESRRPHAP